MSRPSLLPLCAAAFLSCLAGWSRADGAAPVTSPATSAATSPAGLYVAVGYGGRRMSSGDGLHWANDAQWSDKAADDDNVLFNVAFGLGRFVAVGGGAKVGHLLVTRDGKAWRELAPQKGRVATIAFGDGRFVAGHDGEFLVSTDGEAFRRGARLDFQGSMHFRKSAFGNGVFVVLGDCDPHYKAPRVGCRASTRDGETVAGFAVDTPAARAVAFGAGRFVVVGPDGLRESSADGKTWEHRATEPGENLSSVVWTGARFLAGGGKTAWSSPDGIEWKREARGIPGGVLYCGNGLYLGASWGGNLWHATSDLDWKKSVAGPGNSFEAIAFGETPGQVPGDTANDAKP